MPATGMKAGNARGSEPGGQGRGLVVRGWALVGCCVVMGKLCWDCFVGRKDAPFKSPAPWE